MSHAWFQGVVTIATWDDVWLSEGMATYHEALYHEHLHGAGTIAEYTDSLGISYRAVAEMAEGYFPLSKPKSLWGVTTYRKGALVLHTLSYLMGRDVFDQFLNDYLEAFSWGSATTEDFRLAAESASGLDLSPFFDEWVHGLGYPQLGLAWRHTPDTDVLEVAVEQLQPEDWPLFLSVPIEVEIAGQDGETQREMMNLTDRLTVAEFDVSSVPGSINLDPNGWLLKTVEDIEFPDIEGGPEPVPDAVGPEGPPTGGDRGAEVVSPPADATVEPTSKGRGGCTSTTAPVGQLPLLILLVGVLCRLSLGRRQAI